MRPIVLDFGFDPVDQQLETTAACAAYAPSKSKVDQNIGTPSQSSS
jgi:hypothetical protein